VVDSSDPGSLFTANAGSGPIPPQRALVGTDASPGGGPEFTGDEFILVAPDGTTVTAVAAAGVFEYGSDCFGFATGVGGTGEPYEEG